MLNETLTGTEHGQMGDRPRFHETVVCPPFTIGSLPELIAQDNVHGLVFDLDGTLIDSAADIIRSLRVTFQETGLGELPDDYFPANLHGTSDGIMRSVIRDMGWPEITDLGAIKALYVENYAKLGHTLTKVYAGVPDMLDTWADRLPLGICTNKRFGAAIMATETVGIREHFKVISGADTWEQAKPSPIPLLATIQALGIEPEHCLYFGDTSVDAECAQRAGVRFVLHESGYGDKDLHGLPRAHAFKKWSDWY